MTPRMTDASPLAHPRARFRILPWSIAVVLSLVVLGLVFMPPLLGLGPRTAVMKAFQFVCHQIPGRSPSIDGIQLAVCHRCLGIYLGFVVGVLVVPLAVRGLLRLVRYDRILLALALVPISLDWSLGVLDLWSNSPGSRLLTGLVFGLAAGLIAGRGLAVNPHRRSTPLPDGPLASA